MSSGSTSARRLCLACGEGQLVRFDEPIWPLDWRCPACGNQVAKADGISMFAPTLADTVSGFDPIAFAALAAIEDAHYWFLPRNELIVGFANRFFPDARNYLEIGCGNGAVLRALAQSRSWKRLVGSDLHPTGLAHARARLPEGVEFVQLEATRVPAIDAFDLTGAFDVIEHIADDEAVLRSLRQATTNGGGTIIAVPQHPWLWSRADEIAHHQRRYRRGELERKLQRAGFEILHSTSYTSMLLPLMAANRLKARSASSDHDLAREFAVGSTINALLTAILRAEVRLTLAGLRWPVGGSRVVIARAV
jgi:SAM-dependent methyltransferase